MIITELVNKLHIFMKYKNHDRVHKLQQFIPIPRHLNPVVNFPIILQYPF